MSVIAYFDESGDDGIKKYSSETFILTSIYMNDTDWENNFNKFKEMRKYLKSKYNLPIKEEFHTANFFTDKNPYRQYNWSSKQRKEILSIYASTISILNIKCINVIIDKNLIKNDDYPILTNALTYNIQRIENDSDWKYIIISDKGRINIMRKTARAIRNFNPITSHYTNYYNVPVKNLIEDILEKDSIDSYFIQISDFISYIVNLYYKYVYLKKELPNRIKSWLTIDNIKKLVEILSPVYNKKASNNNEYGFVIYPKFNKKSTTLPSFEDGVVQ